MKLSCALLLTNGNIFLAVIPTGGTMYDLPKGLHDIGESIIETVIREVEEETGFNISKYKNQLEYMGRYKYTGEKDIGVFLLKIDKLPLISGMKCSSLFGVSKLPEVSGYRYISFDDLEKFRPQMVKIIRDIKGRMDDINGKT